jgi:hypothetical protein
MEQCGNTSESYDALGCYVQTNYPIITDNLVMIVILSWMIILVSMYLFKLYSLRKRKEK